MAISIDGNLLRRRALAALVAAAFGVAGLAIARPATAAQPDLGCSMTYSVKGWSAIFERADGTGQVTCKNGQSMPVVIHVRGGGLTAGKWRINDGHGTFTHVFNIDDVLGNYAAASASAGLVKSASAQVLTKGEVSLAIAGKGQGINIGVAGTRFEIERAK